MQTGSSVEALAVALLFFNKPDDCLGCRRCHSTFTMLGLEIDFFFI